MVDIIKFKKKKCCLKKKQKEKKKFGCYFNLVVLNSKDGVKKCDVAEAIAN